MPDLVGLASAPDLAPITVCSPGGRRRRPVAGASGATPFTDAAGGVAVVVDVTAGTNDLDDVGCCRAAIGHGLASRYGVVRFDRLAGARSKRWASGSG